MIACFVDIGGIVGHHCLKTTILYPTCKYVSFNTICQKNHHYL